MKQLELLDLTLSLFEGGCKLQSGRIAQWRHLNKIKIECFHGQWTLSHGAELYVDLDELEAEQVAKFLNIHAIFIKE